jgi:uncharacterized membrane protein YdbT with pleckstrin-like domain
VDPRPGEAVFFHGHPSWRSMLGFYLKGFVLAIAVGVVIGIVTDLADSSVKAGFVALGVVVVLALVLVLGLVRRIQTTYTITDQRLTIDHGLLARDVHECRLERVQNVNSTQSLLERLLRIGTVDFDTAAGAEFNFAFRGVGSPHEIVQTVDRALNQLQRPDGSGV